MARVHDDSPAPVPQENYLARYGRAVVQITAALTALSFLFYAFGYVIVNLNFSILGVRAFGLVNAIYLPAGVAFVAVTVIPLLILLGVENYLLSRPHEWPWWPVVMPVILTIVYGGVLVLFTALFLRPAVPAASVPAGSPTSMTDYGRFPLWAGLFALASFTALALVRLRTDEPGEMVGSLVLPIIVTLALLFLLTLFSWAKNIYPVGAPEVGGGRTVDVSLVLLPPEGLSAAEFGQSLGLDMSGNVSERVRLLYEDAATITVLLPESTPLKVDGDNVLAVRYFPAGE